MNVLDRLQLIADAKCKSIRAFEISIGKTGGYLNSMKKRGSIPGIDVIQKTVSIYSDVNTNWLITGIGEMFNSDNTNTASEPQSPYKSMSIDKIINAKIESLKDHIDQIVEDKFSNMWLGFKEATPEEIAGSAQLNAMFEDFLKSREEE